MEIPIHPKLQHLSAERLQDLFSRYYANEPVGVLMREFDINSPPSQLHSLFPPEQLEDQPCPYCQIPMIRKRPSRSSPYTKPPSYCAQCGHLENTEFCRCSKCEEAQLLASELLREHRSTQIQTFCEQNKPFVSHQPSANDLNLRTAVALLALTRTCLFVDSNVGNRPPLSYLTLESLDKATIPFTPQGELAGVLIDSLMSRGLIGVSPLSREDAFIFQNHELQTYDPGRVRWALHMQDPESLIVEIEQMASDHRKWPPHWVAEANGLWSDIAFAECKEFYRYCAAERGLPASGERSMDAMLRNLLQDFSVAQCYRIIYGGAQRAIDFLVRTNCNKRHAANYMIGECQRWADRAKVEKWDVRGFKRNYDLPRSTLSFVFFDVFLKIGENGFNLVPSIGEAAFH